MSEKVKKDLLKKHVHHFFPFLCVKFEHYLECLFGVFEQNNLAMGRQNFGSTINLENKKCYQWDFQSWDSNN